MRRNVGMESSISGHASRMTGRCLAVLIALLAGCASETASTPAPAPPAKVNLSGYPPEFKQGYADGCASAQPNAARKRDATRFKSDANYLQGWRDGYDICEKRK